MGVALVVELRKKISDSFAGDTKLHFVKTHIKAVDGLMAGEKIKLSLLPSEFLKSKKQVAIITQNATTAGLLSSALSFVGGNTEALTGCFFIVNSENAITVTVSENHQFLNYNNETGTVSYGQSVTLEDGDQISINNYGIGWEIISTIEGYGTTNPTLPNGTYPMGARFFNTTDGFLYFNFGGNWATDSNPFVDAHGTTLPGSPTEDQTYFVTSELTKYRYKSITGWSLIDNNMPYAVGAATVGESTGGKISPTDISKLFNLVSNADHTGDVTGSTVLTISDRAVSASKFMEVTNARILGRTTAGNGDVEQLGKATVLSFLNVSDGADVTPNFTKTGTEGALKTITAVTVTGNKLTGLTFDDIQDGSTTQKGVLQLATGNAEWRDAQSTSKPAAPNIVKSMIDWFGGLDIDSTVGNLDARHPNGAFALLQTGTITI